MRLASRKLLSVLIFLYAILLVSFKLLTASTAANEAVFDGGGGDGGDVVVGGGGGELGAVEAVLSTSLLALSDAAVFGWAKRTPWYITLLISSETTREASPESPEI